MGNKGIFLDRDGVINYLIFNPKTNEYEAPQRVEDLKLFPWTIDSLKKLQSLNYKLFIVSNQPDYAKGKTSLENIFQVHSKLHNIFTKNKIAFAEYYYCYHHPQGVIKDYSIKCECRKPKNFFLRQAKLKYDIDMENSWFVGDRDSDIYCGQSLDLKTILIRLEESKSMANQSKPDYYVDNLQKAVEIINKSG